MEEYYYTEDLPHALIAAGLRELEEHHAADFSLRRVANACGVSCAAPYRHFKSREGLILAIIAHINSQWLLMQREICKVYENDRRRCALELCLALLRFLLANHGFRAVMVSDNRGLGEEQKKEKSKISLALADHIREYLAELGVTGASAERRIFSVLSMIYGACLISDEHSESFDKTVRTTKENIEFLLM
jgi:AcrR family transcriptional regulator